MIEAMERLTAAIERMEQLARAAPRFHPEIYDPTAPRNWREI